MPRIFFFSVKEKGKQNKNKKTKVTAHEVSKKRNKHATHMAERKKATTLRKEFTDLSVSVVDRVLENAKGDLAAARETLNSFKVDPMKDHREGVAYMTETQKVAFMRGVISSPSVTDDVLLKTLRQCQGNVNHACDFLLGPQGPLPPVPTVQEAAAPKKKKADAAEMARQREEQKAREAASAQKTKEREAELEKKVAELQKTLGEAEAKRTGEEKRLRELEARGAEAAQEASKLAAELEKVQLDRAAISRDLDDARHRLMSMTVRPAHVPSATALALVGTPPVASSPKNACTITASPSPEDPLSIVFSWDLAGVRPSPADWIGLYIHDREFNNKFSATFSTGGKPTGEGVFSGLKPGFWDLRLFLAGTKIDQVRTLPVLLGKEVIVKAEFDPDDRRVDVTWVEAGDGKGTPATNGLGPKDWIGMFHAGTKSNKKYLSFQYCTSKELMFAVPRSTTTTDFEFRYFRADSRFGSSNAFSGRSAPVTVPNRDLLAVLPTSSATSVRVRWSCTSQEPSTSDWIGIHEVGAADSSKYLQSKYTCKGVQLSDDKDSGIVEFDLSGMKPGNYEIRYFSAAVGKYTPLMNAPLQVPPPMSTEDLSPQ